MQVPVHVSYDIVLIVLSYAVAVVPSYGALDLARHARAGGPRARTWLAFAGVALGFGIWATHWVAALSLQTSLPVAYDLAPTLAALALSIGASTAAFWLTTRRARLGAGEVSVVAALITVAATGTHYLGLAALQISARPVLASRTVLLGILAVFAASLAGMWLVYGTRETRGMTRLRRRLFGALLLGVGIAGGHAFVEAGTSFVALPGGLRPVSGVEDVFFIVAIALGATVVLGLVLAATIAEARGSQRQMGYMVAIMSVAALLVGAISGFVSYAATLQTMREALREAVSIQGRFIEAVARFDEEHRGDRERGREVTLEQVADAQRTMPPIGRTGEFLVGVRRDGRIEFLGSDQEPVPRETDHAEPIRRALAGEAGTLIGPDYRGVTVLAAYRHVPALDIGLVAKVDMAEVREPFVRVALIGGAATFGVILLGALLFIRFASPILRRLREGEFVDTILASAPQAIALVDRTGAITKVNDRFAGVFGYEPDQVQGRQAAEVLAADEDRDRFAALRQEVLVAGHAEADLRGRRPDGELFWARLAGSPAAGLEPGCIVFSGDDVTGIKEAAEAIEAAEERYRRLVEAASDLVWSVDASGRWTFLNAACEEIYGVAPDELLGTPFLDRIAPEDRESAAQTWGTIMAGGEIENHETVHLDVHGERKTLSFSGRGIRNEDGSFGGAQGTARDVTERARAIAALNELVRQQELLRSLINNTPDLVFYKDEQGVYRGCNYAFSDFVGMEEEEIVGRTAHDIFPGDRASEYAEQDAAVFEKGEPIKHEHWVEYPDGRRVLLDTLKTPFHGPDGERLGLIGISRDVTDRKRIEERLEALAQEAQRASAMKSVFLANMSHEIRTPMNGVLGMTELLLETDLDLDQRQAAELAKTSAESLLQILDDILDFSKIEAGQLSLESVPFDLHRVVDAAVRVLAVRAAGKNNELVIDIRPEVPGWVRSDPGRLRQVLTNLVSNAVKFTEAGEVVVTVTLEGGGTAAGEEARIHFSVRDSGIGIPEEKLDTIFGEFVQADTTTTRTYGGTGLGLTISRRLVELLGGTLEVESKVDVGSEFFFTLPLEVAEAGRERALPAGALEGRTVLVVDDHPLNRRIAREHLRTAGVDVQEASDAKAGLALIRKAAERGKPLDVAVVDCLMPGQDGFQLAEQVRADPALSSTRLMMLTSAGRPGDARTARELGIQAYLIKPITRSDLLQAVATLLGRTEGDEELITRETVAAARGELRILVAEDNPVNQIVATSMLRSRGHTVDVVETGTEALDAVKTRSYDLVLMDVQMPEMDGIEATRAIRQEPGLEALPIIALTAHALPEERDRCMAAGMNAFLSKPFKPHDLYAVVERWTGDEAAVEGAAPTPTAADGEETAVAAAADAAGPTDAAGEASPPVRIGEFRSTMRAAGIEHVVDATIEVFLSEAPGRTDRLARALDARDADAIAAAAHALKSAARNIHAVDLGELLESLEAAARDDDLDRIGTLGTEVMTEFERVTEFLRKNGF